MSDIIVAPISSVDSNPFRLLGDYPYVERKLDALQRSYADVGMWEGVIARRDRNRFQIAFGHHRIEAAKRSGERHVPLIVRDLTDQQMLQFMGRENLEDYNADFLIMLETWEAATKYQGAPGKITKAFEIARLLGWTYHANRTSAGREGPEEVISDTARACNAAHALLLHGHLVREDLRGLSVKAAREIVERAQTRIEQLDRIAQETKRPAAEINAAKHHVAKSIKTVARDYREGKSGLGLKDLRSQVDIEAHRNSAQSKKQSPLFGIFGKAVAESIHKMLREDAAASRLAEIEKSLVHVIMEDDFTILRRIDFELAEHAALTEKWRERLTPKGKNVTPLSSPKLIERRA